jgi:hypothetical protein
LISAVETVFGLSGNKFCGPEKTAKAVLAKEVLILIGREHGARVADLSLIAGLDTSNISRRCSHTPKLRLKAIRRKYRRFADLTPVSLLRCQTGCRYAM